VNVVDALALSAIRRVGSARGGRALLLAGWGWLRRTAWWVKRGGNVVSARRENVGLAVNSVSIKVTRDDTGVLEVAPSSSRVTSVTTLTARVTALEEILRGDSGLVLLAGSDAKSIGHGLDGTESPA